MISFQGVNQILASCFQFAFSLGDECMDKLSVVLDNDQSSSLTTHTVILTNTQHRYSRRYQTPPPSLKQRNIILLKRRISIPNACTKVGLPASQARRININQARFHAK